MSDGAMRPLLSRLCRLGGVCATLVAVTAACMLGGPLADGRANADSVQTVPSQNLPLQPFPHATPPPMTRQPGETTLVPRILPGPQGNTRELPLPEVFRGCWSGSVPRVDSIVPLSPDAGQLIWLTKTYILCYKQTGYGGRWKLTFAEGSVADRTQVSDQRQLIRVKSVSGSNRAELTAFLHFRAPQINGFGMSTGVVNALDELAHLHCNVIPDENVMDVRAAVFVENNDQPYANITWHTRFFRVGGGS